MKVPDYFSEKKYTKAKATLKDNMSAQLYEFVEMNAYLENRRSENSVLFQSLVDFYNTEYIPNCITLEQQINELEEVLLCSKIPQHVVQKILEIHASSKPKISLLNFYPKIQILTSDEIFYLIEIYQSMIHVVNTQPNSSILKHRLDMLRFVHDLEQLEEFMFVLKTYPDKFMDELRGYDYTKTLRSQYSHTLQRQGQNNVLKSCVEFIQNCWDKEGDVFSKTKSYIEQIESLQVNKTHLELVIVAFDMYGTIPEEIISQIPFED
jgi:hypothetical protein